MEAMRVSQSPVQPCTTEEGTRHMGCHVMLPLGLCSSGPDKSLVIPLQKRIT